MNERFPTFSLSKWILTPSYELTIEKCSKSQRMERFIFMQCLNGLICISLLLSLVACGADYVRIAQERIPLGTPRGEAIEILLEETWYHQPCLNAYSIDDLFFFGSHTYEQAQIVIVRSRSEEELGYRVTHIGGFDNRAWQAAYQNCIDRSKFQE